MPYTHARCGGVVYVDLSSHFKIVGSFSPGKNVMISNHGDVLPMEDVTPASYFCSACKTNIPIDEMMGRCGECGIETPISQLWKADSGGYICCTQCKELPLYKGKSWKNLIVMAKKISTKNL